jgi:hypothetical protein
LDRSHPLALELAQNPDFRDLDVQLFAGPESAALCPLKVFEVTGHRPN